MNYKAIHMLDASPPEDTGNMYPRTEFRDARDVTVFDHSARPIGVLDQHGDMIYRFPERIGF